MLLLILLSMGWAVTRHELTCKIALFSLWSLYTIVHCLLYIWKKVRQEKWNIISSLVLYCIWFRLQFERFFVILVWGGCDWRYRGISDHSRNHHSRLEGRCNDCVSCSSTWYHGSWVHTREDRLFSSLWSSFTSLVYISPGIWIKRLCLGECLLTNWLRLNDYTPNNNLDNFRLWQASHYEYQNCGAPSSLLVSSTVQIRLHILCWCIYCGLAEVNNIIYLQ